MTTVRYFRSFAGWFPAGPEAARVDTH